MKFILSFLVCLAFALVVVEGTFCCKDRKTSLSDDQVQFMCWLVINMANNGLCAVTRGGRGHTPRLLGNLSFTF